MKRVVLITGASAGMGKETAKLLAKSGYKVYGAARRLEEMQGLKKYGVQSIFLDVTNDESIRACTKHILSENDRIDILINNAGFGLYGAIEDVSIEEARNQLEVNVFGAARLIQLVLPKMREYNVGKIVNISSVGGEIAGPMGGWYHTSKFALEGLSDSLRNEVKPFGIDVIVIQPGATKTEWGEIAFNSLLKNSGHTAYKELARKIHKSFSKMAKQAVDAEVVAKTIKKSIESKNPKTRYTSDFTAGFLVFLKRFLSDKLLDKLYMSRIK